MSARVAQPAWADTPMRGRLAILRRFRHSLAARANSLAGLLGAARRAPRSEALAAEVVPLADACRFLERATPRVLAARFVGRTGRPIWLGGVTAEVARVPFGVVLVLGPANYPLFLPGVQALQALAAGNAVLWKPGSGGGAVAAAAAEMLYAAGLNRRLLAILPEGAAAGAQAIDVGVDKVVLTGSAETGRTVLGQLASRIVPAVAELSGCDAAFVLPGADLDRVAAVLDFALRLRQGATCIAPRRIIAVGGDPAALEARLGAVADRLAGEVVCTEAARRAARLVRTALGQGARVCGGRLLPDGEGLTPMVLADVPPASPLLCSDVGAPVAAIVPAADEAEALARAGAGRLALGATIFGPEPLARRLAARVRAGVVVVNDAIVPTADPRLPFGGRDGSGFGVTRGPEGLLEMTAPRVVIVRRGAARHLRRDWPAAALFEAYLRLAHGGSWRERGRGLFALAWQLVRSGGGVPTEPPAPA